MSKPAERPRCLTAVGSGLAAALVIFGWQVAEAADPAVGEKLAREWCTACHFVGSGAAASDAAPAFAEIANDPAATPARWRAWLIDPHPPMPNLSLSREEVDAIVAFLESLKDN